MADIQGAFSIGHDDGTWLTALFEAANVATMVFAPWFGITFTLKRFTIGAVIATMLLRIPLSLRTEPAYALCVACPAGDCRRMPAPNVDHRGAALSSAQK
jgi:DHA2 family multidrug resistance protein